LRAGEINVHQQKVVTLQDFLSSFALPPNSLADLKIVHGSCRENDAPGSELTFDRVEAHPQ
jgi:hypothetical protein